jgi:hypothetical protein
MVSGGMGCASLLLMCSFLTARHSKWMRNGLVIALFAALPLLCNIAMEALPYSMTLAIPVALGVYMGIRLKKPRVAVAFAGVAVLLYVGGGMVSPFFFDLMLVLACWQAVRYAEAGVFSRALVAVGLVAVCFNLIITLTSHSPIGALLLLLLISGGPIMFLAFTMRQFNQLVERNG